MLLLIINTLSLFYCASIMHALCRKQGCAQSYCALCKRGICHPISPRCTFFLTRLTNPDTWLRLPTLQVTTNVCLIPTRIYRHKSVCKKFAFSRHYFLQCPLLLVYAWQGCKATGRARGKQKAYLALLSEHKPSFRPCASSRFGH